MDYPKLWSKLSSCKYGIWADHPTSDDYTAT
jgi:hypothetical protein